MSAFHYTMHMASDTIHISKSLKIAALYASPLLTVVVLMAMLNITDPLQGGPLSILVVFILLYLFILSVLCALLHIITLAFRLISPKLQLPLRRGYYLLSVATIAPVLLIALNTLGQLDILEGALIFVFVSLGCFYILRRTAK